MPQAKNGIATRQQTEELFGIHHPLGVGSSYVFPVREVVGYSAIAFLSASDQPIEILIEESCEVDGPFAVMETLVSTLDFGSGLQMICRRLRPGRLNERATSRLPWERRQVRRGRISMTCH